MSEGLQALFGILATTVPIILLVTTFRQSQQSELVRQLRIDLDDSEARCTDCWDDNTLLHRQILTLREENMRLSALLSKNG